MQKEIFALAKSIGSVDPGEEELLARLSEAAEAELTEKLKQGVSPEDCHSTFVVAAAWITLAGLCISRQEDGITAWSAGEVSVKHDADAGRQAETYRKEAQRLMRPYCMDDGFVFVGVKG